MASVQQRPTPGTFGDKKPDQYAGHNPDVELSVKDKIDGLLAFMKHCRYGMMTTRDTSTGLLASRCMELAATESNGTDLLFFTNTHTHKVDELAHDPHTNISFVNHVGEWASIAGSASVVTDRDLIRKHYKSTLRAWLGDLGDGRHDGSAEDPRLGLIRVRMTTAACSISGKGLFGTVKDVVTGAMSGKAHEVAKMRELSQEEVDKWRSSEGASS
ncbi:related to Protein bli-3 [Cephalotrichum gorgonifer]|uniref:Related to Protein bli-3 n=1 Tax=Cephalotrichum gorgonifer TaxID=2041049 RepID=A0AAE8MRQ4_9PEZI|nr:related to Protein bli-3 [Cephalotrichum gorgonifer]